MGESRDVVNSFMQKWEGRDLASRARPFVVISSQPVGVRTSATLSDNAKSAQVLLPGQCVLVIDTEEIDGTKFLKLGGGYSGWVFENKPDESGDIPVMAE